jgi:hypothetical protein
MSKFELGTNTYQMLLLALPEAVRAGTKEHKPICSHGGHVRRWSPATKSTVSTSQRKIQRGLVPRGSRTSIHLAIVMLCRCDGEIWADEDDVQVMCYKAVRLLHFLRIQQGHMTNGVGTDSSRAVLEGLKKHGFLGGSSLRTSSND